MNPYSTGVRAFNFQAGYYRDKIRVRLGYLLLVPAAVILFCSVLLITLCRRIASMVGIPGRPCRTAGAW